MRRLFAIIAIAVSTVGGTVVRSGFAQTAAIASNHSELHPLQSDAPRPASPYDRLAAACAPYMTAGDPLGFPAKVRAAAAGPYAYWRATKPFYYAWAKDACADWLADGDAFCVCHGDLHLGNIGSYPSADGWSKLAFAAVDFDESARLPFQLELVQGYVTLRLVAEQNHLAISADLKKRLLDELSRAYAASLHTAQPPATLLGDEQLVADAMKHAGRPYEKELAKYTSHGKFLPVVTNKTGQVIELIRPATDKADAFANAISAAITRSPETHAKFRLHTPGEFRAAIKDVGRRSRLGSAGSQGFDKYLVLLDRPLVDESGDVILYLKREAPSAAERAGIIPADHRSPGERLTKDAEGVLSPRPYLNAWCDVPMPVTAKTATTTPAESFWLTVKEPWSEDLDPSEVTSEDALFSAARVWGTVAAAVHRPAAERIRSRLSPALWGTVADRGDLYLKWLDTDYTVFRTDPRTAEAVAKTDAVIRSYGR